MNRDVKRNGDGTVSISEAYYKELLENDLLFTCLQNAGVDNWDGWDFAMEEFHSINE